MPRYGMAPLWPPCIHQPAADIKGFSLFSWLLNPQVFFAPPCALAGLVKCAMCLVHCADHLHICFPGSRVLTILVLDIFWKLHLHVFTFLLLFLFSSYSEAVMFRSGSARRHWGWGQKKALFHQPLELSLHSTLPPTSPDIFYSYPFSYFHFLSSNARMASSHTLAQSTFLITILFF